jgi:hypothetical protein
MHGAYLVIGRLTRPIKDRALSKLKIKSDSKVVSFLAGLITFALVCFAWIVFRANTMQDAWTMMRGIFEFKSYVTSPAAVLTLMQLSINDLAFIVLSTAILLAVQIMQTKFSIREYMERRAWPIRWVVYLGLIFGIILLGYYGLGDSSFIYFQF